jgi:hypothetical protein
MGADAEQFDRWDSDPEMARRRAARAVNRAHIAYAKTNAPAFSPAFWPMSMLLQ